jgi:predicted ATP-dependent endonuclease of OLD family
MIEAWVAAAAKRENEPINKKYRSDSWKDLATERARDWFGGFTPMVNFPSLVDIEEQLASEIEKARVNVWRTDQTFASLSETKDTGLKTENLLANIQELFIRLEQSPLRAESRIDYPKLREQITHLTTGGNTDSTALRVLKIYSDTLQSTLTVQQNSFAGIQKYLSSVNEFLDGKSLIFKQEDEVPRNRHSIQIQFNDGSFMNGLRVLSSGERQIMTLVYAATHMSHQEIVLIDEPEISLHVDWQRMLIKRMAEQLGKRQIIACTHSPVVGADHFDSVKELSLSPTKERTILLTEDEEETPF